MSPVCEVRCKVSPKTPINFLMCSNVRPRQPTWSIIILISRKNLLINLQLTFLLVVLTSAGHLGRRWQLFCGDGGYVTAADSGYLHLSTRLLNTCARRHLFLIVVVFRVAINHLMRSWKENFSNEDRELQTRSKWSIVAIKPDIRPRWWYLVQKSFWLPKLFKCEKGQSS